MKQTSAMELKNYISTLKRDYDSSQTPTAYDTATLRTLDAIVYEIELGRAKWSEIQNLILSEIGQTDFSYDCLRHIRTHVTHQSLLGD